MASGTSPFAACVRAQATSTELVVFAPSVGQAVEIAWYIFLFHWLIFNSMMLPVV